MLYGITAAAIALLFTALLAALLRAPARWSRLVDRRRQREVPLSGGVAVVVVTGAVVCAYGWVEGVPTGREVRELLVAGGVVALLGLVDDVWRLRRRVLFAGTAAAAACVVPYGETGVGTGLLAVVWVAGLTLGFRGSITPTGSPGPWGS